MPSLDYRLIRQQVAMAHVLDLLGFVASERRGDQVRGPCPLHQESGLAKERTFSANLRRNCYKCFKCGSSGNQLDLWTAARKMPLHAATLELCNRLGLDVPGKMLPQQQEQRRGTRKLQATETPKTQVHQWLLERLKDE